MLLPQELIDTIINEVSLTQTESKAKRTLSACCLVSKSFLHLSRQKLWNHLILSSEKEDLYEMHDLLKHSTTPTFVRTLSLNECYEPLQWQDYDEENPFDSFFLTLLPLFPNVNHVVMSSYLDDVPSEIIDHMVTSWKLTTITFDESNMFDDESTLHAGFLTRLPGLKDIRFVAIPGSAVDPDLLEEQEFDDEGLAEPESLYMDISPRGFSILQLLLRDEPTLFSLSNVKCLTLSFTGNSEGNSDDLEDAMHQLLSKVSLDELIFRIHDGLLLSSDEDMETISIASIRRVSFTIFADFRPYETAAWWIQNIDNALDADEDWAIEELEVNVVFNRWTYRSKPFDNAGAAQMWKELDRVFAIASERTNRIRIAVQWCGESKFDLDVHVTWQVAEGFREILREAFVRSSKKDNIFFASLQEIGNSR